VFKSQTFGLFVFRQPAASLIVRLPAWTGSSLLPMQNESHQRQNGNYLLDRHRVNHVDGKKKNDEPRQGRYSL
jgi:hypothetical protein